VRSRSTVSGWTYVFISTVSVYADHSVPQVEGKAVIPLAEGLSPGDAYGAGKAAAEAVVIGAFGGHQTRTHRRTS
jgi:nucleoside-diphosphate-sugar epimerase